MISAVTSAFIIQFDSQLQPDSNDETAALLRLLIYKIDNTTFGNDVPTLAQWTGPPRTIVQVQVILFATLTISLLSAFLAMLGKQWLNRYESTNMRGSAIERSHDRQRKFGGIVGWYFDYVMESLPLMLQAALLLLGCALSRYLWDIDVTVASVVLGVTSFGVIFYLSIVIVGTTSESCPYQTPAAHFFRHILRYLLPTLRSAFAAVPGAIYSRFFRLLGASWCCKVLAAWFANLRRPWYSTKNFTSILPFFLLLFPTLALDVCSLGRVIFHPLIASSKTLYYQLMGNHKTAHRWFTNFSPLPTLVLDQQTITMDLQCISWILQTSLDKAIRLLAFKHLTSLPHLAHFHPTLVVNCFNIFIGCISISSGKVVIIQGLEHLAAAYANKFFRTLHHLATTDPASSHLVHLQRQYNEVFPSDVDFTDLPFRSTMTNIHTLAGRFGNPRDIGWPNYSISVPEHIPLHSTWFKSPRKDINRRKVEKYPD